VSDSSAGCPFAERAGFGVRLHDEDRVGRISVGIQAAEDVDVAALDEHGCIRARLRQRRARPPRRRSCPTGMACATNTSTGRVCPSLPPTYRMFSPTCTAPPSVRGSGNASDTGSDGLGCHGVSAPTGGGQGRSSFGTGGQRLIGDQARIPSSSVRLTVK
jgi:hypothetical protein